MKYKEGDTVQLVRVNSYWEPRFVALKGKVFKVLGFEDESERVIVDASPYFPKQIFPYKLWFHSSMVVGVVVKISIEQLEFDFMYEKREIYIC